MRVRAIGLLVVVPFLGHAAALLSWCGSALIPGRDPLHYAYLSAVFSLAVLALLLTISEWSILTGPARARGVLAAALLAIPPIAPMVFAHLLSSILRARNRASEGVDEEFGERARGWFSAANLGVVLLVVWAFTVGERWIDPPFDRPVHLFTDPFVRNPIGLGLPVRIVFAGLSVVYLGRLARTVRLLARRK